MVKLSSLHKIAGDPTAMSKTMERACTEAEFLHTVQRSLAGKTQAAQQKMAGLGETVHTLPGTLSRKATSIGKRMRNNFTPKKGKGKKFRDRIKGLTNG